MVDKYAAAGVGDEVFPGMEGRTHHIRVAQVLRDRLEAFIAGTGGDGAELQRILDFAETELAISANDCEANNNNKAVSTKRVRSAAVHEQETIVCGHSCLEHEDLTRRNLWQRLPRDLLPQIFARLPFAAIARLQSVSKAWQESISSCDSEFSRELEAANNHRRIALITPIDDSICPIDAPSGRFRVRIYDVQEEVWHLYIIQPMPCASCMLGAADGGLVCFVSVKVGGPCSIVVVDPLTMFSRNLPPLHNLRDVQPAMAQLLVDANTGNYKVVVAGYTDEERQELEVEVYDSEIDEWTEVDLSERFYGYEFYWDEMDICGEFAEN